MPEWILFSSLIAAASSLGFAALALLWLRRVRRMVRSVLGETALHQVNTANRLGESIRRLQLQNQEQAQQIVTLGRACQLLRQELLAMQGRQETTSDTVPESTTIH